MCTGDGGKVTKQQMKYQLHNIYVTIPSGSFFLNNTVYKCDYTSYSRTIGTSVAANTGCYTTSRSSWDYIALAIVCVFAHL